jgi:oligopeptidase A
MFRTKTIYTLYHVNVQMSEFADKQNPSTNPFFDLARLPQFEQIDIEKHADEAIRAQIDAQVAAFKAFETDIAGNVSPTFSDVFDRLERDGHALGRTFGVISTLSSTMDSKAIRDVRERYMDELTEMGDYESNSVPLFDALNRMDLDAHPPIERRIIEETIKGMKRNGFGLPTEARERMLVIMKRQSELSMKFGNNSTDAAKATYTVRPEHTKVVSEAPSFATAMWRSDDSAEFAIGLNGPSVCNALQYIADETVRKEIYMLYVARAGEENGKLVPEILTLRQEMAEILGFKNHTDLVLDDKMVRNIEELDEFYAEKYATYSGMAQTEMDALEAFAGCKVDPWDVAFYSNLKDKHDYGFTGEDTKPYLETESVLGTLYGLCEELFGMRFAEIDASTESFPETWHPDVRVFEVYDRHGVHRSTLFLDLYVRPGLKNQGAWCSDASTRTRIIPENKLPVAHIVCNFSPPETKNDGSVVSLLTIDEAVTCAHELGHSIQAMMTDIDIADASGFADEWDSVEIQSQHLELFATNRAVLMSMRHHETGEPMPEKMIEYIINDTEDKGMAQCRQIFLGSLDIEIHRNWKEIVANGETIWDVQERIYNKYVKHGTYIQSNRLLATFGHIFAGSYSSSYYGYMYSKEISKRLYATLVDAPDTETRKARGRKMLDTVYAMGSSLSMSDILDLYFERIKE